MSHLRINSIMENPSLCDGIGYRTVLFLQGCNLRCKGCQNKSTWDIEKGVLIDVKELAKILREKTLRLHSDNHYICRNKSRIKIK